MPDGRRHLFDSHCHIIDHRFPIIASQGYVPLAPHAGKLSKLPQPSIGHLGMTEAGLPVLLERIARASPEALVSGTGHAVDTRQAAVCAGRHRARGEDAGTGACGKALLANPLALYRFSVP